MGRSITWHDRRWQQVLQNGGLSRYEDFLGYRSDRLVWERFTTQTSRLEFRTPDGDRPTVLYLKKYVYPTRRWRFLLRRDKPDVEVRNYDFLRRRVGPCVPEVIATGRRRRWMMLYDAFILTRELPQAVQLDDYARRHWKGPLPPDERARQRHLLRATADLVRRMHAVHFYHIDLQWRNILVRFDGSSREAEVFLIDAPRGGRRWLWFRRTHGRVRDLSNLDKLARHYLSRTDRLRWYVLYAGGRRLNRRDRRLITAVLAERARYDQAKARLLANCELGVS